MSSRGPREPSAAHKHRNHVTGQKAGPANFYLKKFDSSAKPEPSNRAGPLQKARDPPLKIASNDARLILNKPTPKDKTPRKQRPKDDAKGVINAIKRNAFETIDGYIDKLKPKNFKNAVTCLENARTFLAEHFGDDSSPDMLINRVNSAESRYHELFRVTSIYKQVIDNIMDDNVVATHVVGLKGAPGEPKIGGPPTRDRCCLHIDCWKISSGQRRSFDAVTVRP